MKKSLILILSSLFLLGGCSTMNSENESHAESYASEESNVASINPAELSPDEVTKLYQEEQLALALNNHLQSLDRVSSNITTEFSWNDVTLTKNQSNYETYTDTVLSGYTVETEMSNDNQSLTQDYHFDGETFYQQFNQLGWNELPTETKYPMTYFYFLKYLVEGDESWDITVDDQEDVHVAKEITYPDSLASLPNLIDIPIILSPQAEYQANLDYHINPDTGQIISGNLNVLVHDLGEEFKLTYSIDSTFDDEANPKVVDLNKPPSLPESDSFLTNFETANPSELITYYETTESNTSVEEEPQATVTINNPIQSTPWVQMKAPIVDGQPGSFNLLVNDMLYQTNETGDITNETTTMTNHYSHFVNRFISEYERFESVEAPEDPVYTFREYHENDFATVDEVTGDLDVSHINRNQEAMYAIDYLVDKSTYQLLGMIIWSVTPEEEEINVMTSLNFGQFNLYSPQVMTPQVDPEIWEQASNNTQT